MQKTIEDFYFGNLNPNENFTIHDPEYKQCMRFVVENEQKLLERLGSEDRERLERMHDNQLQILSQSVLQAFVDGYKIGSRLMVEVLSD